MPFVVSQLGVLGDAANHFLLELAQTAAKKEAVRNLIGARSEGEAKATLARWFRAEFCAAHVRQQSRRIIAYYRSFHVEDGRGSCVPGVRVAQPLERRAARTYCEGIHEAVNITDLPRW